MTETQKKEYIEHGGVRCPYCDSYDLKIQSPDFDYKMCWVSVSCLACGKEWDEHYVLEDIIPLD